jgi:solute carrier family 45 protein 1/2/4
MMFNTVPFQFVGLVVAPEKMGMYMGVLNSFGVIGQQISNFAIGSGVGAISKEWKAPIIGSGSIIALVGAIGCYWMTVPTTEEPGYTPMNQDEVPIEFHSFAKD